MQKPSSIGAVSVINSPSERRMAFLLAGLAMIGPFSIDTYLPAFPAIAADLNASVLQVQQSLTAYLVLFAAMTLWHGAISDALGRRRTILAGLALYAIASLFCAFATRIEILWLGRAIQGIAGGVGFVVGRAVIRDLYHGPQAQRLMANVTVIFAIAPAIAPMIGGQLQYFFNWHGVFFFLALLACVLFFGSWLWLPETLPPEKRQPFKPQPLWDGYKRIFSSTQFLLLTLATTANFAGMFIYILSSPVFIIQHLRLSPQAFGWMFVPMVAGMMLGSMINARVAGKHSQRRTVALAYAIMISAAMSNVVMNALLPPQLPWAIAPLFVYVLGTALAMPCLQMLSMDLFPDRLGMASSCQGFIQSSFNALLAGIIAPLLWDSTLTLALGMFGCMTTGLLTFACYLLARSRQVHAKSV